MRQHHLARNRKEKSSPIWLLGLGAMVFLAGCTSDGGAAKSETEPSGSGWATGSSFLWETNESVDGLALDFSLAAPTDGAIPACKLLLGFTVRAQGAGISTFRIGWAAGEVVHWGVSITGDGRVKAEGFDSADVLSAAREAVYGQRLFLSPFALEIPTDVLSDQMRKGPVRYVIATHAVQAGPSANHSGPGADRMDNLSAVAELACDGDVRYQFDHTQEVVLGNQEEFEEGTMVVGPAWTASAEKGTLRAHFTGPHVDVVGHSLTSFSDQPVEFGSFQVKGPAVEHAFEFPFSVAAVHVQGGPGDYEMKLDRIAVAGKGKCAPVHCSDLFAALAFARTTPLPVA